MTCDEAREAFTDLYDGTLSGPPLTVLSHHLDGCRACRLEWAAFRKAMQALGDLRDEEPSPGFAARVIERIEGPTWWRRAIEAIVFPLRLKLPIHAVALVLLGVAGIWIFQRSPELRQAAKVGAPVPTERSVATPPPAPLPDKVAVEPRPEAGPTAPPPAPPAKKAESEPAAARALRSAPDSEGSGAKMESALQAKPASPAAEKEIAGSPAGTADDLFSAAATEYAAQDYKAAIEHFRAFLAQYPKENRAPDAQFFQAEAYWAQHRYAEAGAAFGAFLGQYPDHRRAPVALYRQGEARLALGDASGCGVLREALGRYPSAREAAAAREALAARCQ
jgi:tol-pal system protein YbgF